MNRIILSVLVGSFTIWAQAADVENGAALHDENCLPCHSALMDNEPTQMYTREARKVDSFSTLQEQVQRFATTLGRQWSEDELADVTTYLNETFYHFDTIKPESDTNVGDS